MSFNCPFLSSILYWFPANCWWLVTCMQTICNMSYEGLMACKPAATPPNPPPPTTTCCSALSHADMVCLCSYRNSKVLPSLGVDPNLAMQLLDKCDLPHPARCWGKRYAIDLEKPSNDYSIITVNRRNGGLKRMLFAIEVGVFGLYIYQKSITYLKS